MLDTSQLALSLVFRGAKTVLRFVAGNSPIYLNVSILQSRAAERAERADKLEMFSGSH